ncbi:Hypothetical protein R9X50_00554500 [Acrodontium crateriforme]|uniref:Rho-GAP domain-containing protein n=1 Tax=Acrodontium crateriforme TaxID=150365 RepID=A0AAQ3M7B2_9PEZI|nr:Hypothetical protein R9X50_00554500 [Acrodontium crateriforme]
MANTAAAGPGGPWVAQPPPPLVPPNERVEQKEKLANWWKNFKRSDKKAAEQEAPPQGIFGVPLQTSILYANVAISLLNDEGQSYIYGYVPIIVAKCGVYLKEKATDVEGIFRLAGSEKRIKELKAAFDSPEKYGKGLDWTGYTVHDAANILRRYFNQLPEPIIPLEFYERFRNPLRNHQAQAVGAIEAQSPSVGEFDQYKAIQVFQDLITELPPLNRQLLLYILDLLAVFASKSDLNKMTTPNLSAIFQPGILSHPQHDMAPEEYRLSQDVLIFLIENQDSFLIGMRGTAADPDTVRDVQSGTPGRSQSTTPTTPGRPRTTIARSTSGASVGAESVRKWGNLRRNVSTSSRTSRLSDVGPTPVASAVASPSTPTGGVGRSNTVPSRRGGSGTASPHFPREKNSTPPTPSPGMNSTSPAPTDRESLQNTPVAPATSHFASHPAVRPIEVGESTLSEATTPLASATERKRSAVPKQASPLLSPSKEHNESPNQRSVSNTSSAFSGAGGLLGIFKPSQTSDGEGRKPKKLQKKRTIPGSSLSSAQSSTQSLENVGEEEFSPRSPARTTITPGTYATVIPANVGEQSSTQYPVAPATPQRNPTDTTLRPTASPPHSFHSQTDMSDADFAGDEQPAELDRTEKKRNRWRFSRSQNTMNVDSPGPAGLGSPIGNMTANEQASKSTIGSAVNPKRRSFQDAHLITPVAADPATTDEAVGTPSPVQTVQPSNTDPVFSDSERERKGPMSWIRGKLQERKEKDAEKRNRTPDRNRGERHERQESKQDLRLPIESAMPVREKPVEAANHAAVEPQINVQPASPPESAHMTEASNDKVNPAANIPTAAIPAAEPVAEAAPMVQQASVVHQTPESVPIETSVPSLSTPAAPSTKTTTITTAQVPELTPQEAMNTFSAPQPAPETILEEAEAR